MAPTLTRVAAAFLGMLNGMGRDRGAALVLEQAILPATTTNETRTRPRFSPVYDIVTNSVPVTVKLSG
jgi:hypothetical protein